MENGCIIHTSSGVMHGEKMRQGTLHVFRGVPYACPPVGKMRFRPPRPLEDSKNEVDATRFAPISIQRAFIRGSFYQKEFYPQQPPMSENSLYLNIWAPVQGKNLPIAFWIHGGGYMAGYAYEREFNPEALAAMGMVVVAPAYRLGMLGFLAHEWLNDESGLCGNYGLMDLALALRWTARNAVAFGGDSQNITVLGQSAGARLAQILTVCPNTQYLIRRAVFQSGGGLEGPLDKYEIPLDEARQRNAEFLHYLGIENLEQLRHMPARTLQLACCAAQRELGLENIYFCPVLDEQWLPMELHGRGGVARSDIDILLGSNADDFGSTKTADYMRDACSRYGHAHGGRTWQYLFARKLPGDQAGAFHSAELWYVFGTLRDCWRPFTLADETISERMMSYWANFIRYGDPNQADLPLWLPCPQHGDAYLRLDHKISMFESAD